MEKVTLDFMTLEKVACPVCGEEAYMMAPANETVHRNNVVWCAAGHVMVHDERTPVTTVHKF